MLEKSQDVEGTHRFDKPVSNNALKNSGGVPTLICL